VCVCVCLCVCVPVFASESTQHSSYVMFVRLEFDGKRGVMVVRVVLVIVRVATE
jgi:hypothetical protein